MKALLNLLALNLVFISAILIVYNISVSHANLERHIIIIFFALPTSLYLWIKGQNLKTL